ncbi:stage III sporulation protein SpoAB [Clostridium sp. YIM B02515]|jgi:stage III sporulation protein AB|uniref:Stage III sporulation protein SpoAB n=1 Tax=Clostridium rhizosphaerae TaxID=2803861 RepID=A0ABS1TF99_9CLOT|nr:stage III sporulation protein SpoIIIAB [Clostridium rhizosphaerae]MBL4937916.1 stage III sporulation protein SpoAB [Clostridium rhizosphaerae]
MIKEMGCLIIVAASTIAGFMYSEKFKKRVKQLNEFERAINQLQDEIEYTHTHLPEAFNNIAEKSENPINKVFSKVSKLLYEGEAESVYDAFEKSIKDKKFELNLDEDDINVILDLSKTLGDSDIDGHKRMFSLVRNNLKKRISIAEISMSKNVKMYRYLGFTIGAMLVIVLI